MKRLESSDPFELVGVPHGGQVDIETDRATARCLVEDYALTGFSGREILRLFASPDFGLPNAILLRRGQQFVHDLVAEVFGGAE